MTSFLNETISEIKSYIDICFSSSSIPLPNKILIVGVPGIGKTILLHLLSSLFRSHSTFLNGFETILTNSYPSITTHSIILFDNMDILLETPNNYLLAWLDSLSQYNSKRSNNSLFQNISVCIIGAVTDLSSVSPVYFKSERFEKYFYLPIPNAANRKMILKELIPNFIDSEADIIISLTSGYVFNDLIRLCRLAYLIALSRSSEEKENHSSEEKDKLPSMKLIDFMNALKRSKPLSFFEFDTKILPDRFNFIAGNETLKGHLKTISNCWASRIHSSLKGSDIPALNSFLPCGILFHGIPGSGKTLIARALAGESQLPTILINSSRIYSKYFGESEKILRNIFFQARTIAPCVLLFDDIDVLTTSRMSSNIDSGVQKRVLSTFLNELDGVQERKNVFLIATTSKLDCIDSAFLRPGRMDQIEEISLDFSIEFLTEVLRIHSLKMPISNVNLSHVIEKAFYCCTLPADIVLLCKRASLHALLDSSSVVTIKHFEIAISRMKEEKENLKNEYKNQDERNFHYSEDHPDKSSL